MLPWIVWILFPGQHHSYALCALVERTPALSATYRVLQKQAIDSPGSSLGHLNIQMPFACDPALWLPRCLTASLSLLRFKCTLLFTVLLHAHPLTEHTKIVEIITQLSKQHTPTVPGQIKTKGKIQKERKLILKWPKLAHNQRRAPQVLESSANTWHKNHRYCVNIPSGQGKSIGLIWMVYLCCFCLFIYYIYLFTWYGSADARYNFQYGRTWRILEAELSCQNAIQYGHDALNGGTWKETIQGN